MSTRLIYTLNFLLVAILLSISIYLQMFDGFIPCPLCTLQRFSFGLLAMWFLIGALVPRSKIGRFFINIISSITALLGCVLAGRQIWLQHYPSMQSGECGVSLQYMMQVLPLNEVMQRVFIGTAECTQRGWQFLSLNMAEWSLLWFIFFLGMSVYLLMRKTRPEKS